MLDSSLLSVELCLGVVFEGAGSQWVRLIQVNTALTPVSSSPPAALTLEAVVCAVISMESRKPAENSSEKEKQGEWFEGFFGPPWSTTACYNSPTINLFLEF